MSKLVAIVECGGEHPLRHLAKQIWGINIVRTARDLVDAPPSLSETFQKIKDVPPMEVRCGCCSEPMRKAKGMAVLRIDPPDDMPSVGMIPMGLCGKCLKDPDGNLTRRVLKTLTGVDRPFKDWKDMLQ